MARTSLTSGEVVKATPEKGFFISMLVKDIELIPAISDLVDNSVDGARRHHPDGNFHGLHILIEVEPARFRITDNCGGIDAATAQNYAFRFGRPEEFKGVQNSIGQFGVGMKRALFKLGDLFTIRSTAPSSKFEIRVDVPIWAADDTSADWTFRFSKVDRKLKTALIKCGTEIVVEKLHPQIKEDFGTSQFVGRLAAQLELQHQSALAGGLRIRVNRRTLVPNIPKLLSSKSVQPINYTFDVPANGSKKIHARLVAGIAKELERRQRDAGDAEDFREPDAAGWYVFCNDRLVLAADRTELTGWGNGGPAAYHPQYRRFRGYLFLSSKDATLLPLNTTKTGLDQDARSFRAAQQVMIAALGAVQGILNRLKREVSEQRQDGGGLIDALGKAKEEPLDRLEISQIYTAPVAAKRSATGPRVVNVQYRVARSEMDRAKRFSGESSASRVGQMTFEYYMRNEVEPNGE